MSKDVIDGYKYCQGEDISADYTGPAFQAHCLYGLFVQYKIKNGTSPTGTLKVQVTSDVNADGTPQNWIDYAAFTSKSVTDNLDGYWENGDRMISAKWLRVVWDWTSGDGELDVRISGVRL